MSNVLYAAKIISNYGHTNSSADTSQELYLSFECNLYSDGCTVCIHGLDWVGWRAGRVLWDLADKTLLADGLKVV